MYRTVITLFNHSEGIWYATTFRGVYGDFSASRFSSTRGEGSGDNALLHIRYKHVNGIPTINGKPYKYPKDWNRMQDKSSAFTFQSGDSFDFFMVGEWNGSAVIRESDYEYGSYQGFYDYMNATYDNVYAITSVGGPYNLLPHFSITGR